MKVAELKLVVDANAVEMRQEFVNVRAEIADLRTEMRDGFAAVDQKLDAYNAGLHHEIDLIAERVARNVEIVREDKIHKIVDVHVMPVLEKRIDERIDEKLAAFEHRLPRKRAKR